MGLSLCYIMLLFTNLQLQTNIFDPVMKDMVSALIIALIEGTSRRNEAVERYLERICPIIESDSYL